MKARDLPRNATFTVAGSTYRMLAFVRIIPEPLFILENMSNGYVFESHISPDMEVEVESGCACGEADSGAPGHGH